MAPPWFSRARSSKSTAGCYGGDLVSPMQFYGTSMDDARVVSPSTPLQRCNTFELSICSLIPAFTAVENSCRLSSGPRRPTDRADLLDYAQHTGWAFFMAVSGQHLHLLLTGYLLCASFPSFSCNHTRRLLDRTFHPADGRRPTTGGLMSITYYQLLGLESSAKPAAIQAAYRRLMLRHHPDHHGQGDDPVSRLLNQAY
ncbi:MAG: J domain-containing protein [Candidatus Kerfeldbacteria bacterium]|nr:J domain-containing protein [Candidatus Kerfeldbacteria bacterium]